MSKKEKLKTILFGVTIGIAYALATAWLFYDFEPISMALILTVPFFVKYVSEKKREACIQSLDVAFKDALQYFRNGLDAGCSPECSLKNAVKGLEGLYGKKAEITKGFERMAGKISTGMSMEQAFLEFAAETKAVRIKEFAELFRVLKRTGGNLNKVIRRTIANLTDSINLRRDLNVAIAAKKSEFNIMCAIPYGILLYLKLLAPEMSEPLYHSKFGIFFMTLIWVICVINSFWGHAVIRRTLQV